MADAPNPRVALLEANLATTRAKLNAAEQRVLDLQAQIIALEDAFETELGLAEPEPEPEPEPEGAPPEH